MRRIIGGPVWPACSIAQDKSRKKRLLTPPQRLLTGILCSPTITFVKLHVRAQEGASEDPVKQKQLLPQATRYYRLNVGYLPQNCNANENVVSEL